MADIYSQSLREVESNPTRLRNLSHAKLIQAREIAPDYMQNILAQYEHGAFAREAVAENPLLALPVAVGALAYQPYKAVAGARSKPSIDQVIEALIGVKDGLKNSVSR